MYYNITDIEKPKQILPALDIDVLQTEPYRVADNSVAYYNYGMITRSFQDNAHKVTHGWGEVAELLGRQIQIDLANGYTLDQILPEKADTVGAHTEIDKRPSQIFDLFSNRNELTGQFINIVQFLVMTSENGNDIHDWFNRHNQKAYMRLQPQNFTLTSKHDPA